jgi:hypothetical protein
MIAPVDDRYIDREFGEADGCLQAAKAAADNDHAGAVGEGMAVFVFQWFGELAHCAPLCK